MGKKQASPSDCLRDYATSRHITNGCSQVWSIKNAALIILIMGHTDPETIKYLIETTWFLTAIVNMFILKLFVTRNCNIVKYLADIEKQLATKECQNLVNILTFVRPNAPC